MLLSAGVAEERFKAGGRVVGATVVSERTDSIGCVVVPGSVAIEREGTGGRVVVGGVVST